MNDILVFLLLTLALSLLMNFPILILYILSRAHSEDREEIERNPERGPGWQVDTI